MRRKISGRRKAAVSGKKRKTTRRRRRISGIGSLDIGGMATTAAAVGAGAVGARLLNTVVLAKMTSITPLMSGAIQTVAGAVLPMFVKNNQFVANMGKGMMANGVMVMVVSTGAISGLGSADTMTYRINGRQRMNGINSGNVVNGLNAGRMVSGINSGNVVNGRKRFSGMAGAR